MEVHTEILPDDLLDIILDEVSEGDPGALEPWVVIADTPYAAYVEFGTEPASKDSRGPPGKNGLTRTQERFREWAKRNGRDEKFADRVYHNIMENGAYPNPYMRPALYGTLDVLEIPSEWDYKTPTPKLIAERVAEQAKRYVEDYNGSEGPSGEGEGLAESIRAMPLRECLIDSESDNRDYEELWSSDRRNDGIRGRTARNPRYR